MIRLSAVAIEAKKRKETLFPPIILEQFMANAMTTVNFLGIEVAGIKRFICSLVLFGRRGVFVAAHPKSLKFMHDIPTNKMGLE